MEQPSVTYSATQSVDYLGQTHKWTDTDVISSYKEICKQLDIVQEKLREEREQKGQRRLRKSSSHSKQLSQKAALQAQQSQRSHRGRNDNIATLGNIGNISKQLKQQKDESALRAEEKRLIRMKNALWRRMGPSVGCVGKGNKLVSPKTLKWQKECDILWLYGPLYQPDNDPFMEDDDDKTLVGTPPDTGCPPSPSLSPYSTSPTIKPALKKPVEHDPLKDLISYACEVLTHEKPYPKRRHTVPIEPKQKKKSIRFSRNLEQVHYTPTHYTIRPISIPQPPPQRRRMSNPFFTKMEEDLSCGKNVEKYDQIFAWAKEQVKSTGKLRLFGEDGAWLDGNSNDDDDDEFVMPPLPPLVKSIPRRSPSASPRSPNRRSPTPPSSYTATSAKKMSAYSKNSFVNQKHVTSHVAFGDSETAESGVVERCVNIASNVKDVVSWCGSMLWNSTVF
ncbi:uncharacterized protein OCT59_009537 [Rhizophagus irregularis]|uniref:Uncharacterized protein n=4 Tax=Rhizophagus irregularis TaxID=588596 RepID=A0A915ZZB2_9GLOM|nr:hypothetical protein OCT59_009537 [Rhizophagus irregularis]CAB5355393.1 unnamed protein product [Rhizophagus irregularis]CAB5394746.1 unnamed protein product [Rhizophagus irregularis]